MTQIHQPHDKLFREIFGDLAVTRDFLQHYLPAELLQAVNMDGMSLEKESFIKKDLQEVQSDLLFQTEIAGNRGYIYFLFEHKSFVAEGIAFQLLGYMLEIWKREREKLHRDEVSFIVPLVLYHGEKEWRNVKGISDWIVGYGDFTEIWRRFVPNFEFIVYDFSLESDAEIIGDAKLQAYLRLIKTIREPNIDALMGSIGQIWHMLELGAVDYFQTLLIYILNERQSISIERLVETLNAEGREVVMSTAEQLRMEGREEGREEGLVEGREEGVVKGKAEAARDTAVRLLDIGLEPAKIALATALSVEEVERIAKGMMGE